jgi:hypothetical protein
MLEGPFDAGVHLLGTRECEISFCFRSRMDFKRRS